MGLAGFDRLCVKRTGGVDSLFLADAGDVESTVYDPAARVFKSVALRSGAAFARYDFREDSCRMTETVRRSGGAVSVKHEVTFLIPGHDGPSREAADGIAGCVNGLVAIVVTSQGDAFLVGYSHIFGGERPLKLVSARSTSGIKPTDASGSSITLSSEDTDLSCLYIGGLPR